MYHLTSGTYILPVRIIVNQSINNFFENVESLRKVHSVSKENLFNSVGDIFNGSAWTRFLNYKSRVHTWDDYFLP